VDRPVWIAHQSQRTFEEWFGVGSTSGHLQQITQANQALHESDGIGCEVRFRDALPQQRLGTGESAEVQKAQRLIGLHTECHQRLSNTLVHIGGRRFSRFADGLGIHSTMLAVRKLAVAKI
jgi:hypothetical protein